MLHLPRAAVRRSLHVSRVLTAPALKVQVNGIDVEIPAGSTVLQACAAAGVHVPRFCYHDRLSIAGNCRMCLVEVVNSPKPVASCAMPAMPNMKIKTDTPVVHKAREGVLEFLLANHPLDCPICDQGGECDLQDQYIAYGLPLALSREIKRTVEDKNLGPLVKTVMTRCIHCTRCIRFSNEVAGVAALGATGRGNLMEIGTYVNKKFDSELSGNVIDLCPVGALTSKPTAFTSRQYECHFVHSVDVMDAVGSNIRIDRRGNDVMKVSPRLNEEINEEWLADKARFSLDGARSNRIDTPMIKRNGQLEPCFWRDALLAIVAKLKAVNGSEVMGIAGDLMDAESLMVFKDLLNRLGSSNHFSQGAAHLGADIRDEYLFNSTIAGLEDVDFLLLVGSNPRMEAALVNARIRKAWLHYGLKVASVGPATNLTYPKKELGNDLSVLEQIASGTHKISKQFQQAKNPAIIVGMGALGPQTNESVRAAVAKIAALNPNAKINFLHTDASRVAAQDLGLVPGVGPHPTPKVVFLLGADSPDIKDKIPPGAFVIYQGSHGDEGASMADVVLPGSTYFEKSGTYVNLEGRPQKTQPVVTVPADLCREDFKILIGIMDAMEMELPYTTLDGVRARMARVSPTFANVGECEPTTFHGVALPKAAPCSGQLAPYLTNHWMTNPILRSSVVMGKCTSQLPEATSSYI